MRDHRDSFIRADPGLTLLLLLLLIIILLAPLNQFSIP